MQTLVQQAYHRRQAWIAATDTDSYRLFHGAAEGAPGVTIDRYASEVLVQVFREGLKEDWPSLAAYLEESQNGVRAVRVVRRGSDKRVLAAVGECSARLLCREGRNQFWNSLVQVGNDPWFYLDFRAARRFVSSVAENARVANFFSYTGTAGIAAATAGALAVSSIDFGRWCMDVCRDNFEANQVESRIVRDDFFSVARQWAGAGTRNRRKKDQVSYGSEKFDLVILDPPTRSSGPNGAVDIVRDYPSLAKPCMQMLAGGGWLVCSHHHTGTDFDTWQGIIERTAAKIGRRVLNLSRIPPDLDFPVVGDEPLLKVLALQLD